ncbi:MAG: endo-1,4-beta-xylanase [Phycisphaerae bacterium]
MARRFIRGSALPAALAVSTFAATFAPTQASAGVVTFDPADGYRTNAALSDQPADGSGPTWRGTPLATVIDLGDGNGAAQTVTESMPAFASLRLNPGLEAAGSVPFAFKLRPDAPPSTEDFDGAWFIRIGHDEDGEAKGNAVRIGIFDNGVVQTENQAGGGTVKMLDADGKQVDLDDHAGRFIPVEGVIDFDAGTYTLSFDGVPQTFNGSADLPFAAAGQDAFGTVSLNKWSSQDPVARQITIDDLKLGDGPFAAGEAGEPQAQTAQAVAEPQAENRPVIAKRDRPAGDGLPAGGVHFLPGETLEAFFAGNYGPDKSLSKIEVVDVKDGPVDRALRIEVGPAADEPGSQRWHAEIKTRQLRPATTGDVGHLRFYARAVETFNEQQSGHVQVYYQHAGRPFDPSFMAEFTPGSQWQRYDVPFAVFRDYTAGGGYPELNFAVGTQRQTLEIGGIELINYGKGQVGLDDLPQTSQTYEGREPDAAWRKAALERIAEHRTSPLRVKVVDAEGNPVAGAAVAVRMKRNAFNFGSALNAGDWARTGPDGERFRAEALRLFNIATPENGLRDAKWYDLPYRELTLNMLRDLKAGGLRVHGHVLVWPSYDKVRLPDSKEAKDQAEQGNVAPLRAMVDAFIEDVTTATADYVDEWDVMNEPWNNNDLMRVMGESEMARWFRLAEAQVPDKTLFINDFGILGEKPDHEHPVEYRRVIQRLLDDGAPVDAIGFQAHFNNPAPPTTMLRQLETFEPFGLRFAITEYDVFTQDEAMYADHLRDTLLVAYGHPQFDGFIMWGFWDATHWKKSAPLFRADWTAKPGLKVWEELVLGEWMTSGTVETNADGAATLVGHHGRYTLEVTQGGRRATVETDHTPDGDVVTVQLR